MKSEEVARLAGVSRSTVSRVINNYSNVPDETREKVMKVVREHNYMPNTSARVLAGKGTDTIGLFIFNVHDENNPGHIYGNSYFGPFVNAVVDRCNSNGYSVLIRTLYKEAECLRIPAAFSEKRMDGAILIGTEKNEAIDQLIARADHSHADHLRAEHPPADHPRADHPRADHPRADYPRADHLRADHLWADHPRADHPLAIVDYNPKAVSLSASPHARIITVNSDDDAGIADCVDYLVGLGHCRIGFITGRLLTWSAERRLRGFKARMKGRGLPIAPQWVLSGDFSRQKTLVAMLAMMAAGDLPTALIASNDDMALVAIDTLRNAGLRVPEDISVIGYDDGLAAPLVRPALTTVRMPFLEMAGSAVEGLVALLADEKPSIHTVTLPVQLIVRESCAPPS